LGTFDPVTNGHIDIIERAARRFDALVVGVLDNPAKEPLFEAEERVGLLKQALDPLANVEVEAFSGLLVEYVTRRGADVVLKGNPENFEYEIQMAQMNHQLAGVETLFMTTSPQWSFLSSSLVKEVARFGGDVSTLVPPNVAERLRDRLGGTA